jgi:hypothetical protein
VRQQRISTFHRKFLRLNASQLQKATLPRMGQNP